MLRTRWGGSEGEAGVGPCAKARAHGCGGTGAERGVWASPGSGTGGLEEGLRPSWLTTAVQKLPAYRRGIHKCSRLVRPEGKKYLLTQRDGDG